MSVVFGRKLIFLDHPRTAGTSTQFGLVSIGGKTNRRHNMIHGRAEIRCCTVRNPYDLLVSWYLIVESRKQFVGSFEQFVKLYQNYNFTRGGRLFYFVDSCNEIMKFETLQADLDRILPKVKLPRIKLQHRNKTPNREHYRNYYNRNSKATVDRRFEKDIKDFKYGF